MFFIDLLYKKITSLIAYFAAVAEYNPAHTEFRATRNFHAGSYVINAQLILDFF